MCKGMIVIGNSMAKCKVEKVASGLIFTDSATGSVLATFLSNEDIFERNEIQIMPTKEPAKSAYDYRDEGYAEKVRKLLGWIGGNQCQLAEKLGLSQSQVSIMLNGKYEGLRWSTKEKLTSCMSSMVRLSVLTKRTMHSEQWRMMKSSKTTLRILRYIILRILRTEVVKDESNAN